MEGWIQVSFFLVILEHSGFNMHGKSNLRASLKEKQNFVCELARRATYAHAQ
jgi:hypothetical protein